jgi:hypothetical protein
MGGSGAARKVTRRPCPRPYRGRSRGRRAPPPPPPRHIPPPLPSAAAVAAAAACGWAGGGRWRRRRNGFRPCRARTGRRRRRRRRRGQRRRCRRHHHCVRRRRHITPCPTAIRVPPPRTGRTRFGASPLPASSRASPTPRIQVACPPPPLHAPSPPTSPPQAICPAGWRAALAWTEPGSPPAARRRGPSTVRKGSLIAATAADAGT